mmetsp:Transcript_18449/g.59538  ORF Transcript_18449/g.59538 Transcript_18449/m.59538 type:complete len:371 (-) Transcript_18449:34-1146(-)
MEALAHGDVEWLARDVPYVRRRWAARDDELSGLRSELGRLDGRTFAAARARCNRHEGLGKGGYVCRSGLKLANLDEITGGALTRSLSRFADVCAAPGGFSQYLLSRAPGSRGVAASLAGANDDGRGLDMAFRDDRLEMVSGDGTGDLYRPANVAAFVERARARGEGVDVCVCDGGFDASRDHADQDRALGRLVEIEFDVARRTLRGGGHCVVKLFLPLASQSTLRVVDEAYRHFRRIALIKPVASRPASGEVYLVAVGYAATDSNAPSEVSPAVADYVADVRATLVANQADACRAILAAAAYDRDDVDDTKKVILCRRLLRRWSLHPAGPTRRRRDHDHPPHTRDDDDDESALPLQFGKRRRTFERKKPS